ncbi:DUF6199 family natural product biosynthesis protein [Nocardiopsis sp. NPDC058631]|uniref:DUF6199 family natural product biosynthesis protein n=1 Tax=Nocardiopsis sp. NPDC058631 TaxID=3346566 RepID=UPI00366897E4
MPPVFPLLVLLLIGAVAVMVNPHLVWKANSWRYRNPEHNEPSDMAYGAYQVSAAVMLVAVIALMASLPWQRDSPPRPPVEAQASPSPEYEPFEASRQDVTTTTTDAGRIRAYSVDEQTVTVYIRRGLCASAQVPPTAEEEEERVVISYAWCDPDRAEPTIAHTVELDEPLEDREVVDTDGEPLRACGPDEVRQSCPL